LIYKDGAENVGGRGGGKAGEGRMSMKGKSWKRDRRGMEEHDKEEERR